jgi:PAS domain S-box-containing protein
MVSRTADLPPEAAHDRETCQKVAGARSVIVFPLATARGTVFGAVSFATLHVETRWAPERVRQLELVSRIFGVSLARRRVERARDAAQARFLMLQASMGEAFASVGMDGRILDFNDAFREMLGYSPEELRRLTYDDITPANWHRFEAEIVEKQVLVSGVSELYTKEYRRKDGTVFPVELRANLIRDASGRPEGMWAIVRDVTGRVHAEQALRESQATLKAVIDSTDDFVLAVDTRSMGLLAFNESLREYLFQRGIRLELGMGIEDIFPGPGGPSEEHRRQWTDWLRRAQEEGSFTTDGESFSQDRQLQLTFHALRRGDDAFGVSVFAKDVTEQQRAQEALRRSEARLRRSAKAARVGVFEADLVAHQSFWSPEMSAIVGSSPEARGPGFPIPPDFVHPGDAEELRRDFERALDAVSDGSILNEHRVVWPDGSVHWVQLRGQVAFAGEGQNRRPIRVYGTIWDISGRRQAEEALRQSVEYYETVLEKSPIGFAVHTIDDGISRFVSATYESLYGCERGAIASHQNFFDVVWPRHPELREQIKAQVVADMSSGDASRMHWENVPVPLATGETRYISAMNIPFFERNLMVSTVWDVTDRVRAEARLRESELRFRQVAENVTDFVWEVDASGLYTYTSPSVEKLLGYTPEELVGKMHFYDLFVAQERERLKSAAFELFAARQPFRAFANTILSKAGRTVHVETSSVPMLDEAGRLVGYRGADCEVGDRIRAEELLRQSYRQVQAQKERLQAERDYLEKEVAGGHAGILGESPALREVLAQVRQVALTDSSVLLLGETGTGKELIAHAIHGLSRRNGRLMVTVNCAALPAGLIESELFGHEKGAFTGASGAQVGRFELADGSTLFLDEVGELPLELQAKLLRVLEHGQFERLGSPKARSVDVRLVAATNRDLLAEVRGGRFRADLFYRLNVFPIRVAPLRERPEDIPALVWRFADDLGQRIGKRIKTIPKETMEALQRQRWPGNVRELRNLVERAVILSSGGVLSVEPLPGSVASGGPSADEPPLSLKELERRHILDVLARTRGRIAGPRGAAALLGVNRTTLQSMLKRLGIARPED